MKQDEFLVWLEKELDSLTQWKGESSQWEEEVDHTILRIRKRMAVTERGSTPFCGGTWKTGQFDYYWTPNDYE